MEASGNQNVSPPEARLQLASTSLFRRRSLKELFWNFLFPLFLVVCFCIGFTLSLFRRIPNLSRSLYPAAMEAAEHDRIAQGSLQGRSKQDMERSFQAVMLIDGENKMLRGQHPDFDEFYLPDRSMDYYIGVEYNSKDEVTDFKLFDMPAEQD